jgi:predicted ATPase
MIQLRAATRLGRLLQAAGEPDGAARIVEPVYATFTEGFATADLLEARSLLDAVAPVDPSGPGRRSAPSDDSVSP